MTWVASNECPPSSKKLSWMPTRSSPRTSAQIAASCSSTAVSRRHVTGAEVGPVLIGGGQRPAIDLAVGRQRQRVQHHENTGNHVFGQALLQESTQLRRNNGRTAAGHHIGRQAFVAGLVLPRQHDRLAYRRVPQQHRLDLAQLDPVAPDLHLMVDPTQVLDVAIGQISCQVAGPIQPRLGLAAERVGDELLCGQLRAVQVAAGHAGPADADLARDARSAPAARCSRARTAANRGSGVRSRYPERRSGRPAAEAGR